VKRLLPPPPTSLCPEHLVASFAVGHGDDFLCPCVPPFLAASFVRGAALMFERLTILRWLMKAEPTFQFVEHHFFLFALMSLPFSGSDFFTRAILRLLMFLVVRLACCPVLDLAIWIGARLRPCLNEAIMSRTTMVPTFCCFFRYWHIRQPSFALIMISTSTGSSL